MVPQIFANDAPIEARHASTSASSGRASPCTMSLKPPSELRSHLVPETLGIGHDGGLAERRGQPRPGTRHGGAIGLPDFGHQVDERGAGNELPVAVHAHDHDEIVEVPSAASKLQSGIPVVAGAYQTHDLLAQRTLHAQHADAERVEPVVPDQVGTARVDQEVANQCGDRHCRRRLGVGERVDLDQQRVGDQTEFGGAGSNREGVGRLSEAPVLGLLRMTGPVVEVLGGLALDRLDQRTALRVAEAVIRTQGEVDIFGKAIDETVRLGERGPTLEDDDLAVARFVEALEYPGDPVVLLDMDGWNPEMPRRGLKELQVRLVRLVQPHRIFQAWDSGQSAGSRPRSKRVVGLREAGSAGNTSRSRRVSSIPSRALVPEL